MKKTAYPPLLGTLSLRMLTILGLLLAFFQVSAQNPIPHLIFHVELKGSEVIPAVNTDARALVTFIFTTDRSKVNVSGMLVGMDGPVTEATVRLGITGQTGAMLLDILPLIHGRHIKGTLDAPTNLLPNLLKDGVYAEFKTTAHPNGEIRGQFVCETDLDFGIHMTGAMAQPPNNSPGRAFGAIHFPLGARDIVYAFVFGNLSSPITKVELHEGIPGQVGTFRFNMPGVFGNLVQGIILLDTIDPDFLRKAREGKYYTVIKTANFPNGELVGQITFLGYFASLAPINGVQQVPPPSPPTAGFGFSHNKLNGTLDSITTTLYINGITPATVKVHIGNPGEIGSEFVDMGLATAPGFYSKKYKINASQLTDFAQNRLYINATSVAFPNGELRGMMKNTLRKGYAFDLCGVQEVPPNNNDALGIAVASVDQANCYLNYKVIFEGLSGPPVDAYFATANFGANGTAFHSMPLSEPVIAGSHEIMATQGPIIENGGTYIQIATQGSLSGEIRGQVRRSFTCPEVVNAVTELGGIAKVEVSPVPFQDYLNVSLESVSGFEGRLVLHDILGGQAETKEVRIVPGEQSLQLSTTNLPKGIYMLVLENPAENSFVMLKKVVRVE